MLDFDYYTAETTAELAGILERTGAKIVAGGTDVLPRLRRGQFAADCLVDASRLADLRYIREADGLIHIGALSTHADLVASPLVWQNAPALAQAAATVGCPQTRQRGTLGGNLANASPAADSAPPLLTLDAVVHLTSGRGKRAVALKDFFSGPGQTCLAESEYIESISFPKPAGRWGAAFYKLGKRSGMAISIVSAAAYLELGADGHLHAARLALGSVAPCPVRSPNAEECLAGKTAGLELFHKAGQAALADISPIADIRASKEYRLHAASVVVQRVLEAAWRQAEERKA